MYFEAMKIHTAILLLATLCGALLARPTHATVTNVAWYRLGETDPDATSGQVVNTTTMDVVGTNHLKRFGSPRYTNGVSSDAAQIGSSLAVSFSGSGQFYSNAIVTAARNNFGIEAWVRTLTLSDGTYVIAQNGNNGWGLSVEVTTAFGVTSYRYSAEFSGSIVFGSGTARGGWNHVALVRDNGTSTFYLNGIARGSTNITPATPAGGFAIAATPQSPPSGFFPGPIDEVRVFTFAPGQFSTNDLLLNQIRVTTLPQSGVALGDATLNGVASAFAFPTAVWFEWGTTPAFGNLTPPQTLDGSVTLTNFSQALTGLFGGDTFFFRGAASNTLGVAYGTVQNFTTLADRVGGGFALSFDGTNDYVEVQADPRLNVFPFVVTAWINTSQTTGEAGIVNKYLAGSLNGWQLGLLNGEVRAWYIRDGANYVWDGGSGLNGGFVADGHWHHVAFTVGAFGQIFVDGVLRDALGWTGTIGSCTTTQVMSFARYPGSAGEFFKGTIDEVAIWQNEPTQGQIQTNMNRGLTGQEISLLAYYRFSEGTNNATRNRASATGTVTDGVLHNGVTWVPGLFLRPALLTKTATAVTASAATLRGLANPGLTNTSAWFEWGATSAYGNATAPQFLGHADDNTNFTENLSGLTEGVYHFRALASNSLGVSYGADLSFVATGTNMINPRASHTATLLSNGKVLVAGGLDEDGVPVATAELFEPVTGKWSATGSMVTNRYSHTATLLPNGKVLVAGGQGPDFIPLTSMAELYDPATGAWTPTGSMNVGRRDHTATLLQNGKVLVAGGISSTGFVAVAELYDPASGAWTSTGALLNRRYEHTANLMRDGRVLVAGGFGTNAPLSDAELYNPTTGTWTATGSMTTNRFGHTATLLASGKVMVVGGGGLTFSILRSAELYDPIAGTWTPTGGMLNTRYFHTATLLPNGEVLASGVGVGTPSLYDPLNGTWTDVPGPDPGLNATATLLPDSRVLVAGGGFGTASAEVKVYVTSNVGSWTNTGSMSTARYGHTATLLSNALVLVASFTNSELYIPTTGAWSNSAPMNTGRSSHTATLLPNGKVLAAGGFDFNIAVLRSAELYDTASGAWTITGSMTTNRVAHTATLLLNGKVLVAGGNGGTFTPPVRDAELFEPAFGTWTATGPMTTNRVGHTATLLPSGKVLVTGGTADNSSFSTSIASAEIFDPGNGTWAPIIPMSTNRAGHKAMLLPDGTVLVIGGAPGSLSSAHSSAEIFDPATGLWKPTGSMNTGRQGPSLTLLPEGRILAAGGYNLGYLSSAEIYDPITRKWTVTATLAAPRSSHTATLLPSGQVLVAGSFTGNGATNSAELYNFCQSPLDFSRSQIATISSPLSQGGNLSITGLQFRGASEGSGGNGSRNSASDTPVLQLRSLESQITSWVLCTSWSTNAITSGPISGFPGGYAMATVFANAIPGTGAVVNVSFPAPLAPILIGPRLLPNGSFQFTFTNIPNVSFTTLAASNLSLPSSNWTALGSPTETSPGQFQFSDSQATNQPQRFYRVRSP